MIFALLLVLLVLAIVSLAVDAYYRRRGTRPEPQPPADTPLESRDTSRALVVLDDRYARGEISRDDYIRTRDDLRGVTEPTTQVIPPEPEPA